MAAQAKRTGQAKSTAQVKSTGQAEGTGQSEGRAQANRPTSLRLAAAAQVTEAAGLFVAGVFGAISTADGKSHQLAAGIVLTVFAFGIALLLAVVAGGLDHAEPWSRTPAFMTQFFVVIAGVMLLDGHRLEWGVPALVLAAVCAAGLLTPASVRALNRPEPASAKSP